MNTITQTTTTRAERIASLAYNYEQQEKVRLSQCNLCGEGTLFTITHKDRYGYPASVDVCTCCGLTFLNPRMTAEAYTDFYISVYRPLVSAYHGRLIDSKTVQEDQKDYTAKLTEILRPWLEKGSYQSLLDVGGSTGVVSVGLSQAYGLKATVIDPAPAEIEEAQALGMETITAFIEDWDPKGKKYDVIGIFQTIDHLLDVSGTFNKLRSVIAPDGLMVVDIVDFRHAYLRNWSINEGTKIDHPYYFTEESTEALLARTGFQPVGKVVSEDLLHIFYICRPSVPNPHALPTADSVREYLREIRFVQGTQWKKQK
ncbi:MAG: class I SAM-dependent methyltransferase [Bacteroidia bacterium]